MANSNNRWSVSQERNVQTKNLEHAVPKKAVLPPPPGYVEKTRDHGKKKQ